MHNKTNNSNNYKKLSLIIMHNKSNNSNNYKKLSLIIIIIMMINCYY